MVKPSPQTPATASWPTSNKLLSQLQQTPATSPQSGGPSGAPPATLVLRIRGHHFTIPKRYQPGHSLTPGEAQALNQLMTENVRNNLDQEVIRAIQAQGQIDEAALLPAAIHLELQARIEAYAERYQFELRPESRGRKSALELEIEAEANDRAVQEAQASGRELNDPVIQAMINAWLVDPGVHETARSRLETRRKVALESLEDLL